MRKDAAVYSFTPFYLWQYRKFICDTEGVEYGYITFRI